LSITIPSCCSLLLNCIYLVAQISLLYSAREPLLKMEQSQGVPAHVAHPPKDYPTSYNFFSTFREEPGLAIGDKYAGGQASLGMNNRRWQSASYYSYHAIRAPDKLFLHSLSIPYCLLLEIPSSVTLLLCAALAQSLYRCHILETTMQRSPIYLDMVASD
jgi:hypothetical protein